MANKSRRRKSKINIDLLIVIQIILLLFALMITVDYKETQLKKNNADPLGISSIYIDEEEEVEEFEEAMKAFRNGSCGMIETYTPELDLMMRCGFNTEHDHSGESTLTIYPDLVEVLTTHDKGYTSYEVEDGSIEHIYYWWQPIETGEIRLIMFYVNTKDPGTMFSIHVISCFVIILLFVLLIRMMFAKEKEQINVYEERSKDLQMILSKQKNL